MYDASKSFNASLIRLMNQTINYWWESLRTPAKAGILFDLFTQYSHTTISKTRSSLYLLIPKTKRSRWKTNDRNQIKIPLEFTVLFSFVIGMTMSYFFGWYRAMYFVRGDLGSLIPNLLSNFFKYNDIWRESINSKQESIAVNLGSTDTQTCRGVGIIEWLEVAGRI